MPTIERNSSGGYFSNVGPTDELETIDRPKFHLKPNVIDGEELQELFLTVFSDMAKYVSRTYGPYGENTCYQLRDKILMTKDGWTVEQEFTYSKNLLANIVRKLIINVSNSIVLHAGDGTSTGLLVANEINKYLLVYKKRHKIHSKTLTSAIEFCIHEICKELSNMATIVTEDNMEDIIHKIALVSLDWNTQLAGFIRDIYKETKNPFIHVKESGQTSSYVSYISGYDLSGRLITEFKINDLTHREYHVERPSIMVFSHSLPKEMFEGLLGYCTQIATISPDIGEFVIMAPDFDKGFRDSYTAICGNCIRNDRPIIPMTLVQYDEQFDIDREMLNDFCLFTGASLITRDNLEYENAIRECGKILHMAAENTPVEAFTEFVQATLAKVESFDISIGCCESFTVTSKSIVASGFGDLETCEEAKRRIKLLESEIEEKRGDYDAKSMFADDIRCKIARLSKLKLKSGIIYVGGFGEDDIKSTKDALDDAINACKVAYTDGVVVGGNIAPLIAINTILNNIRSMGDSITTKTGTYDSRLIKHILRFIARGYKNTTAIMYLNKYQGSVNEPTIRITKEQLKDFDEVGVPAAGPHSDPQQIYAEDLVEYSTIKKTAWNLITDSLDPAIIHPVTVETEILKGILHLILTTVTTNQLFYHGYEGIDEELENMREVPVEGVPKNPLDKYR